MKIPAFLNAFHTDGQGQWEISSCNVQHYTDCGSGTVLHSKRIIDGYSASSVPKIGMTMDYN